jgi:hypothetical protein
MSAATKEQRPVPVFVKENRKMPKRLSSLIAAFGATVLLLALLPIASASASKPWWQVLTGSRPTNMWEPTDNVQEIQTKFSFIAGFTGMAGKIEVDGKVVGCLGSSDPLAAFLCSKAGFAPEQTAEQLEATLEAAFGTSEVDVSGGPVGGEPFVITTKGRPEPVIAVNTESPFGPYGSATTKELAIGGSGQLVLALTNIGDAPVDATKTPVTIVDHLPEGVEAKAVEFTAAGGGAEDGPVECAVEGPDEVVCTYEGELPPYEAILVEISANLIGSPPVSGAPGNVTVSGGNAASAGDVQTVKVSPDPTPFGIERFSVESEEEGGAPTTQAGSHPFQMTTTIQLNSGALTRDREGVPREIEQPALPRSLRFPLPLGLVGNVHELPSCPMTDFLVKHEGINGCRPESVVGVVSVTFREPSAISYGRIAVPVFNLPPALGEPARFGFAPVGNPVVIDTEVDPDDHDRIIASVHNVTQAAELLSSTLTLWGTPGDSRHDGSRGWNCGYFKAAQPCEAPFGFKETAFLRQPVSCSTPLDFSVQIEPWNVAPGSVVDEAESTQPNMTGCNRVLLNPAIAAVPTSNLSDNPSGLDFKLTMPNQWPVKPESIAEGQPKKVEVTLPKGMTVNPSQANGLGACTPQEYAAETFESSPGQGCPEASRIGTVDITTPLLNEEAHGSVFVAAPYDNPFDSLLGLYIVAKIPERGILVKQAGKVELNPETGQLVTTFDDLPQIPFSSFDLHFKEGDRAPLVMPSTCGSYDVVAKFTPWSAADPSNPQPDEIVTRTSSFTVARGPEGGACPRGAPPFTPRFTAGTENNAAGTYSPLDVRLTRQDGEQEFTTFSLKMPKGLVGKLAGIPFCSNAAIAAARARTGPSGGQEELEHPSCPDASQIGRTLVGAGAGQALAYAPGKLYLAGPYKGAKLSIAAITTAKVGPFDLGNVVIRQGLKVNPDTAQVSTDGSSSDPIPHILQGIVVHARDIRIFVDRKDFVLNPTSCERMKAAAAVLGSGLDFRSSADDQPVDVTAPFQAADCANLGFKPKLALSLRGGTGRRAHPRLKAVVKARKGDANIGAAVVKLPHSEFLDQGHIRTICTRVQFSAGSGNGSQCPKGSVYGRARAISPLLDEPLVGLVYLRSSNHALPDLVAALHSKKVDINLDGRIDSVNGGIRSSFEAVPDAPVTKFVLEMQGGQKGLLVNSTNICRGKHRAKASFTGQNGRQRVLNPILRARCGGKAKSRHRH